MRGRQEVDNGRRGASLAPVSDARSLIVRVDGDLHPLGAVSTCVKMRAFHALRDAFFVELTDVIRIPVYTICVNET